MTSPALLLVSHGTSDVRGAESIALLAARIAGRLPDIAVHAAFVDVQEPDAASVLAEIAGPVVVVPLLLSWGHHVKTDIGRLAEARPDVLLAPPLGPDPRLADVLAARIAEGGGQDDAEPVVLAVAGSRDPRSLTDAEGMAGLLAARIGREVVLAFLAARTPSLREVLARHLGAPIATYLLAHGFFFDLIRGETGGRTVTEPLLALSGDVVTEPPPELVALVVDRYRTAAHS